MAGSSPAQGHQAKGRLIMIWSLFSVALAFELVYLLMFVLTIRGRGFRFWPPPSPRSWQFFASWFLALVVGAVFFFLGLLDYGSLGSAGLWLRLPVALIFFSLSTAIGIWTYAVFPFRATLGLGNRLITGGPYRYSRNPEYIGDSLAIVGYMILTGSALAWVIGGLGVILTLLAPFTEEPWLEERFGDEYRAYKARVPRFIGPGRKRRAA
jgi:protein-S-isoprenylcysteine O-methyltransferase Ste14